MAPKAGTWEQAVTYWRTLPSDEGARYDKEVTLSTAEIDPQVTWGTSPEDVVPITGRVPNPDQARDENKRQAMLRALDYMGLEADTPMTEIKRSEEHTSELQSLMRNSYAVFCLKKKNNHNQTKDDQQPEIS